MLIERFYAENYDFGGGGPDEFCRALMIVSLFYFTLLYVKPDYYRLYHTAIQGILFMCVFLIKFNLTVFWVGFILSFSGELLYKKKFSFLIKHMVCFITGAFITAAPYLIYGIFTKSLRAFVNTYFLYNWTYVNPNNHLLLKTIESIISAIGMIGSILGFSLLFSVGLVFVFFVCKTGFKIGYSISLLLLFTAIYYTTVRFATIHIPFTIAILFGIIAVGVLVERYIKKCRFHMSMTLVGSVLIIGITINFNGLTTYDLFLTEQPTAQQQIAEVMWELTKNYSPTLLEIDSLDSGFYTAAGIIPDEPYFFIYNIVHEVYPYPRDAQKKAVEEGHSEFVIYGTAELSTSYNPYNIIELYDEVYVVQGTGYQSNLFYHLFQLRPMD